MDFHSPLNLAFIKKYMHMSMQLIQRQEYFAPDPPAHLIHLHMWPWHLLPYTEGFCTHSTYTHDFRTFPFFTHGVQPCLTTPLAFAHPLPSNMSLHLLHLLHLQHPCQRVPCEELRGWSACPWRRSSTTWCWLPAQFSEFNSSYIIQSAHRHCQHGPLYNSYRSRIHGTSLSSSGELLFRRREVTGWSVRTRRRF